MKNLGEGEVTKYLRAYLRSNVKKGEIITTEDILQILKKNYRRTDLNGRRAAMLIKVHLIGNSLDYAGRYNKREGGRPYVNLLGDRYGEVFKARIIDGKRFFMFDDEYEMALKVRE